MKENEISIISQLNMIHRGAKFFKNLFDIEGYVGVFYRIINFIILLAALIIPKYCYFNAISSILLLSIHCSTFHFI